jgi:hypothetical protein
VGNKTKLPPAPAVSASRTTLSGAVREFLIQAGPDGDTGVVALRAWLAVHHPDLIYAGTTLRTTLSTIKAGMARRPSPGRLVTSTAQAPAITYADLTVVKELLGSEAGDIGRLRDQIGRVKVAAEKVGGVEQLSRAVEALCELRS